MGSNLSLKNDSNFLSVFVGGQISWLKKVFDNEAIFKELSTSALDVENDILR